MADPKQLALLARIARLRRDRSAAALAEASRLRAAEDAALQAAQTSARTAAERSHAARQAFAEDPGCGQAQLWRRVAAERAAAAAVARDGQLARCDAAIARHDDARLDLVRFDTRSDQAAARVAAARISLQLHRDEREADDCVLRGGRS